MRQAIEELESGGGERFSGTNDELFASLGKPQGMRVVRYSGRLEKGLRRINPRGYDLGRLDASELPVVGQFEFPELAGRGMAGLGDGNRGTDIRAAWLRIASELGRAHQLERLRLRRHSNSWGRRHFER